MFQIELWLANRAFHFRTSEFLTVDLVFNTCPNFIHIYIFLNFSIWIKGQAKHSALMYEQSCLRFKSIKDKFRKRND